MDDVMVQEMDALVDMEQALNDLISLVAYDYHAEPHIEVIYDEEGRPQVHVWLES